MLGKLRLLARKAIVAEYLMIIALKIHDFVTLWHVKYFKQMLSLLFVQMMYMCYI